MINLKTKKLTVVTEGGKLFGFGHITRCLAIANVFKKYGFSINFIVNGDESIYSSIKEKKSIYNWFIMENQLLRELSNDCPTLILLDSIEIINKQILEIESLNIPIIFIDDDKRRNILNKGFVVDWTVLSDKKNYFIPRKKEVSYFLGSKYTPLREEFSSVKQKVINENIRNIMVAFGGADIKNLTPTILKHLNIFLPNCKKNIVIGNGFQNMDEIEKYKDSNTKFIYNANAIQMVQLMQESDLAIASGGQTLYELARVGTPTIAILLVENAKDDTIGWDSVGAIKNIGWWDDKNLIHNLEEALKTLDDKGKREEMKNSAKKYINPNGAQFLAQSILERL